MSIKEKILTTIKEQEIKPKPLWYWRLLHSLKWVLISFLMILSGSAVSTTMYLLHEREWDVVWEASENFGEYLLMIIPFFWLIFLGLAFSIIYYEYRHTKEGYKYKISSVVGMMVLISLALGGIIYVCDINYTIDQKINSRPQFNYTSTESHRRDVWSRPERGFLAGRIIILTDKQHFDLLDFDNKQWRVLYSRAQIKPRVILEQGELIRIMGKIQEETSFEATEIRPWSRPLMK